MGPLKLSLEEIESLRAGEIKERLRELQVSTRGIMEKGELVRLLFSLQPAIPQTCEIPMIDVPFYDLPFPNLEEQGKTFIGIDLDFGGTSTTSRFVVDSGASMNLLKKDVAAKEGLDKVITDANTIGMGGSGTIGASVCRVDLLTVLPTPQSAAQRPSEVTKIRGLSFAILDNAGALPARAQGLLGLTFLERLPGIPTFDFAKKVLRFGGSSDPPPVKRFAVINTRKIFTGLLVCDIRLNGVDTYCEGMIDLGSPYTILNTRAVEVVTRGAITSLEQLPISPQQVAGIDGRPVKLRVLTIPNGYMIGDFSTTNEITLYAADIAGLAAIGLPHSRPCCLLGLDILAGSRGGSRTGSLGFDLRNQKLFLEREGGGRGEA